MSNSHNIEKIQEFLNKFHQPLDVIHKNLINTLLCSNQFQKFYNNPHYSPIFENMKMQNKLKPELLIVTSQLEKIAKEIKKSAKQISELSSPHRPN